MNFAIADNFNVNIHEKMNNIQLHVYDHFFSKEEYDMYMYITDKHTIRRSGSGAKRIIK